MATSLQNAACVVTYRWTAFKNVVLSKILSIQYEEGDTGYTIFALDGSVAYNTFIWTDTVPDNSGEYTQVQNDIDKTDFETNYKPYANGQIDRNEYDTRLVRRFGNLTSTSNSEVLVSARAYVEQANQTQRSLVSTNANDSDALATGARVVRITYLNSSYVLKTEDVAMNGTSAVNTVSTDIRFIQRLQVIKGVAAVGALRLMTAVNGGGSEFCGIGAGTLDAFLCHYYVPAGKRVWIVTWGGCVDDEANFKLKSQATYGTNRVDEDLDAVKLFAGNPTPPTRLEFERKLPVPILVDEKNYIRISVVPNQTTATLTRAYLYVREDVR